MWEDKFINPLTLVKVADHESQGSKQLNESQGSKQLTLTEMSQQLSEQLAACLKLAEEIARGVGGKTDPNEIGNLMNEQCQDLCSFLKVNVQAADALIGRLLVIRGAI